MKFLIGFLVTIGLLIVVFILIFRGSANNDQQLQERRMVDYANTSTVMQFTQIGPVSANQTHDELRITVSNVETAIEIFQGYQNNLIVSRTFANNSAAYADFLRALDLAEYDKGSKAEVLKDYRGVCPFGSRYVMGIKDGDDQIQQYWATSCNKTQSFQGNTSSVLKLFKAQVPEYNDIIGEVDDLDL